MRAFGLKTALFVLALAIAATAVTYVFINSDLLKVVLSMTTLYCIYMVVFFQTVSFDGERIYFNYLNPYRKNLKVWADDVQAIFLDMTIAGSRGKNITIYTKYGVIKTPAIFCNSELRQLAKQFKTIGVPVEMRVMFADDREALA